MASQFMDNYNLQGTHTVGDFSLPHVDPYILNNGVEASENVDNFVLGEVYYSGGKALVRNVSAKTAKKVYLVYTPEQLFLGENLSNFYNKTGEMVRLLKMVAGFTRFRTSSYTFNTGVTEFTVGQVAHLDVATHKFIISDSASPHTDYAGSFVKLSVQQNDADVTTLDGVKVIRLQVEEC